MTLVDSTRYFPERSQTSRYTETSYITWLPDGRTSQVDRWNDLVSIAGLNALADIDRSEFRVFDRSASHGMVSFCKRDAASQNSVSPIYEIQRSQHLGRPLFSFSMPRADGAQTEGKLQIGAVDPNPYTEPVRYTSVASDQRFQNLWAVYGTLNHHQSVMM